MDKKLYCVIDDNGNPIAYHMELEHAIIFIKALMIEFYSEINLTYGIMREQIDMEVANEQR